MGFTKEEIKHAESWLLERDEMACADLEKIIKLHLGQAGVSMDIINQVGVILGDEYNISIALDEDKYLDGNVNIVLGEDYTEIAIDVWNETYLDINTLNKYIIIANALDSDFRFHGLLADYMTGLKYETAKYRAIANL